MRTAKWSNVCFTSPRMRRRGLRKNLPSMCVPENRYYEYQHFLNNCCTRIRNLVDEASGGAIGAVSKRKDERSHVP